MKIIDTKMLNPKAVEVKLQEIASKYIDVFDYLLTHESIMATLKVDGGTDEFFKTQENKFKQMRSIYDDLANKYDYFAEVCGKNPEKDSKIVENVTDGVDGMLLFRKDIAGQFLEQKLATLEASLVECEGFFYSYPVILANNDPVKDRENIESLAKENEKTEITARNLIKKIEIFKSL